MKLGSLYKLPGLQRPLPRPRREAKHCTEIEKLVKERYYNCNWLRHCHFPTMTPSESYLFCLVGWSKKSPSKGMLLGFYGIHLHDLQSLLCVIKLLTGISGRKGFQKYFCCSLSYWFWVFFFFLKEDAENIISSRSLQRILQVPGSAIHKKTIICLVTGYYFCLCCQGPFSKFSTSFS